VEKSSECRASEFLGPARVGQPSGNVPVALNGALLRNQRAECHDQEAPGPAWACPPVDQPEWVARVVAAL
jgi:hypothetical protein